MELAACTFHPLSRFHICTRQENWLPQPRASSMLFAIACACVGEALTARGRVPSATIRETGLTSTWRLTTVRVESLPLTYLSEYVVRVTPWCPRRKTRRCPTSSEAVRRLVVLFRTRMS